MGPIRTCYITRRSARYSSTMLKGMERATSLFRPQMIIIRAMDQTPIGLRDKG